MTLLKMTQFLVMFILMFSQILTNNDYENQITPKSYSACSDRELNNPLLHLYCSLRSRPQSLKAHTSVNLQLGRSVLLKLFQNLWNRNKYLSMSLFMFSLFSNISLCLTSYKLFPSSIPSFALYIFNLSFLFSLTFFPFLFRLCHLFCILSVPISFLL